MKSVGVFFGGQSAEHDISIVTAISAVIKPLQATGDYHVVPIYISKDGKWYSSTDLQDITTYQTGAIDRLLEKSKAINVRFDDGLVIVHRGRFGNKEVRIDIAFPAVHGTHGENGELMAVFELANIPYVGCEVLPSAIAMDKIVSKTLVQAHNVPTPKMYPLKSHDYSVGAKQKIIDQVLSQLSTPLFVKPSRLGSSIGISKVTNRSELEQAIEVAFHYDTRVLAEEAVPNLIEVTVPVIGNESPRVALVEQPILAQDEVFDFSAKYLGQGNGKKMGGQKTGSQGYSKLPADIPKALYDQSADTALRVYKALDCSGTARIDLLIDSQKEIVYFNEVNPMPGSLYRHNWHAAGLSAVELVNELISLARNRHAQKNSVSTAFKTNFLKQFL
jgi:D-alanine-D-alanine ligase